MLGCSVLTMLFGLFFVAVRCLTLIGLLAGGRYVLQEMQVLDDSQGPLLQP